MNLTRTERIRALNDRLRRTGAGGRILITHGVAAHGNDFATQALRAVAGFTDFTADNDPHDEHDFGSFHVHRMKLFWKIDYYDEAMSAAARDPAEEAYCTRVLTVMLADEY